METIKLAPSAESERIDALDTLRGFAVLGILVMNVQSYSMPGSAYFFPHSYGDMGGVNGLVWMAGNLLFSQKFMAIFSMLFGAGIVLMNGRARARGHGFGGLHYRRMSVLLAFGLIHAYLLWEGDILVTYALCGLWLYLMRDVRPGRQLAAGLALLAVGTGLMLMGGLFSPRWPAAAREAFAADWRPSPERIAEILAAMRGGFAAQMGERVPNSLEMHTQGVPFFLFWRASGMMLIGMALFQWGVLSGRARPSVYRLFIALALLVGLPLSVYGHLRIEAAGWEVFRTFFLLSQFEYWGSLPIALGWVGALMLVVRAGALPGLRRRLAAVGRMAFSNYIMHTAIASFVFYGHGLALFGRVPRVGQLGFVVAVWILQLWLSPWWLARFRYGPLEWLWRSLSYRARPPFRLPA
jgi:uncharacterized protein